MRALTSHQCGQDAIPRLGVMWAEFIGSFSVPRGVSTDTRVLCSPQTPTYDLINMISFLCIGVSPIDQFTVVCLVAWPLNESRAGVDLVMIQTSLLFLC